MPLASAQPWGEADRRSLLAQYASHLELLSFVPLAETAFDADDWGIQRDRSLGVRLVRVRAPLEGGAELPAVTALAAMAGFLELDDSFLLEVSWSRAGWVYRELALELGQRANASWLRRCALGAVRAPGVDAAQQWLSGRGTILQVEDPDERRMLARVLGDEMTVHIIGDDASPLRPYSAWGSLTEALKAEQTNASRVAESIIAESSEPAWAVLDTGKFDQHSLLLGGVLADMHPDTRWLIGEDASGWVRGDRIATTPTRTFSISPRLTSCAELDSRLATFSRGEREAWEERFCGSAEWAAFVGEGLVPLTSSILPTDSPPEPARSFLAAVALAGDCVSHALLRQILSRLGSSLTFDDLLCEGVTSADGEGLTFRSSDVRRQLTAELPGETRSGLASLVSEVVAVHGRDPLRAAAILFEFRSDDPLALAFLEEAHAADPSAAAALAAAQSPARLRTAPRQLEAAARLRISEGRYIDARGFARALEGNERAYLLALIERKLGHYSEALALLPASDTVESAFLRSELLRLTGQRDEALACLRSIAQELTDEQTLRLEYERSLIEPDASTPELDRHPDSHWSLRRELYRLMASGAYGDAIERAREAAEAAPDAGSRIDASLDELLSLFLTGEWESVRHHARMLLHEIEQTQGDRAAAGVLLTLGFVCADSGRLAEAKAKTERLRAFLLRDGDPIRLLETEVSRGAIALAEHRWNEARDSAHSVLLEQSLSDEIRAAAAWVLAEVCWASGTDQAFHPALQRASGVELIDRALLARGRNGEPVRPRRLFLNELLDWELSLGTAGELPVPQPQSAQDRMMLHRSLHRALVLGFTSEAVHTATEHFGITPSTALITTDARTPDRLYRVATDPFPYPAELGVRIVSRNRLGRWTEAGSDDPDQELIAAIETQSDGWRTLQSDTWVRIEGVRPDTAEHAAIAAIVELRLDRWRRERLQAQEIAATPEAPDVEGFVGSSDALRQVRSDLSRIAPRDDIPVTIVGESGTGKELAAAALHRLSRRRRGPFVPVNCAALPENLIESELFGHARGAFTGADRDRAGLIEAADGGTLFLDEIGELPAAAQAKLLRFLQEKEFRRVGDPAVRHSDARIVAATHRQLEEMVDGGAFRADLFYRIRGFEIHIPPLRDRRSDIVDIANHFLRECNRNAPGGAGSFSDEVEAVLLVWSWPGNARELYQVVRSAHAMAAGSKLIQLDHLPERMRGVDIRRNVSGTYYDELVRFRRELIERSLAAARGNQSQAARALGMTRQALAYQIRELGILVRRPGS